MAIVGRKKELRKQIQDATSDCDREKLQKRLAKISGGVAVIDVGAASEAELEIAKKLLTTRFMQPEQRSKKELFQVAVWHYCD